MVNPLQSTGAVLIGGAARRLGGVAKGLIRIHGDPIVQHQINRLHPRCNQLFLVGQTKHDYTRFGVPIVDDVIPRRGSPGGVHAALYHARTPWVVILACDMPNVTADMIADLQKERQKADVIMYRCAGRIQPLCSMWRTDLEPLLAARLQDTGCNFEQLLDGVDVQYLEHARSLAFTNLNTPSDLDDYRHTP